MGAVYAPTPAKHLPPGEMDIPLGKYLLPVNRNKMCKGEYVDVFSLLFRELEKNDKEDVGERDKEKLQR